MERIGRFVSRRAFVAASTAVIAAASVGADSAAPATKPAKPPKPPALDKELVRAFVGAAHGDLDKTRAMLESNPTLVNACWDWGGGDFETGLGGASHMGRPDIANFLLSNGARMDLFAAAMLGQLQIIRAALTAYPDARNTPGPHGIPLIVHAKKGGKPAEEVVRYIESLG